MTIRAILVLGFLACTASAQQAAFPNPWTPADQPNLRTQLENAAPLNVQNVASPRSVLSWSCMFAPSADGKSWKLLKWYMKDYRFQTRVYICDLATNKAKLQTFPEFEGRVRIEEAYLQLNWDNKMYGIAPDWSKWSAGGEMDVLQYDPAADEIKLWKAIPGFGGQTTPFMLGPDGCFYGAGTFMADKKHNKVGAFRIDVKSGDVKTYAPLGPDHGDEDAWAYFMSVDDQFIYIASGKSPWYLLATNIATGETKILKETPPGEYTTRMQIIAAYPGSRCIVQNGDKVAKQEFWLWHGEMILKTDNTPPWTAKETPWDKLPPRPQVYDKQTDPDANGRAVIWWRPPDAAAKAPANPAPGTKPEMLGWRPIRLESIETYPVPAESLITLADGRLFGTAQMAQTKFLCDTKADKTAILGRRGRGVFGVTMMSGKLYFTGYSDPAIFEYDPGKPWTLDIALPPGQTAPDMKSPQCNPRAIGELSMLSRMKGSYCAATGADGRLYFGGFGSGPYKGGALAWFNPKNNAGGGIWQPFSGYRIYWMTPALNGQYIIVSTQTCEDEQNQGRKPEQASVFIYDTATHDLARTVEPITGAEKTGPLLEVAPGLMLGTTDDPEAKGGGLLYGIDVRTGDVLFRKKLPWMLEYPWVDGISRWDFVRGPDGMIYTFLRNVLVRIDPKTATVEPLGKVERAGRLAFCGDDLYLGGMENLRKAAGVVKK